MKKFSLLLSFICFVGLNVFCQIKPSDDSKRLAAIKKVFQAYTEYEESTDSPDNKALMSRSLKGLVKVSRKQDLKLLLDVWLYYDPTDFPTRKLVYAVFKRNKKVSLDAAKARLEHLEDGDCTETQEDLRYLIEELEKAK